MLDMDQLIRQLEAAGANGQNMQSITNALRSPSGQKVASRLSAQDTALVERAANAFARGDMNAAKVAAMQLMNTPEGASLINDLLRMTGK